MLSEKLPCDYRVTGLHGQIHTRECIDVNDCMLARLVVDDDIDTEERNPESFPQRFTQFPDDIVIRGLGNTYYIISLSKMQTKVNKELLPKHNTVGLTSKNCSFYRTPTYRCEIRGRLWLGHIVAIEENRFSVCKGIKKSKQINAKNPNTFSCKSVD